VLVSEAPSVSDFDSADLSPRSARYTEELNKDLGELLGQQFERSARVVEREREGLPPGYRMRADAHYVEQLSARSGDQPLRSIAIEEIEATGSPVADDLQALVRSIAVHGIVQPLIVRRDGDGYRLIAGRKRLAAARAAKLSRVPCLVHQVDEEQAEALARAEQLRVGGGPQGVPIAAGDPVRAGLISHVSEAIATIESAATMLAGRGTPLGRQVALDLVRAEAWRADWQLRAAAILDGSHEWQFRRSALGPVVVRACERFAAGSRVNGIDLAPDVSDWSASAVLDEEAVLCAVAGAVIATAGLTEGAASRSLSVAIGGANDDRLTVTVAEDGVAPPAGIERRFFDVKWSERPGGWLAAVAAVTVRAVAERHNGQAALLNRNGRGTALQFSLSR
jgi:hypothetical protein